MNKINPILSGTLRTIITNIVNKTQDPIATEILFADKYVETYNNLATNI